MWQLQMKRTRAGARGGAKRVAPDRDRGGSGSPEAEISRDERQPLRDTLEKMQAALDKLKPGGTPQGIEMGARLDLPGQRGEPESCLMMGQPSDTRRVLDLPIPGVDATERVVAEMSEARQASHARFRKMDPPQFRGGLDEDPYEFLRSCYELLQCVGLVQSCGVDFVVLQLHESARQWWRSFVGSRPFGSPPIDWETFARAFMDRYVSRSVIDDLRSQFDDLEQGDMTVDEYASRFYSLSIYASAILPHEKERISKFVKGLIFTIKELVFVPSRAEGATLQSIVDLARGVETLHRGRIGATEDDEPPVFHQLTEVIPRGEVPTRRRKHVHRRISRKAKLQGFPYQTLPPGCCYRCGDPGHLRNVCPLRVQRAEPLASQGIQALDMVPAPSGGVRDVHQSGSGSEYSMGWSSGGSTR